ncbi:MAG TPA: hypothetical protein VFU27_09400, partial [Terriglobales bacterium]|nr:hypothetical protein [Terriglobales bacterium]
MKTLIVVILAVLPVSAALVHGGTGKTPEVVVFAEAGFPAADSAAPSLSYLKELLPEARIATANELAAGLSTSTRLLVMPYGSAFPEAAWPRILAFVERGGNLLVLGGRPFTRAAYRDAGGWHLRDYSVRFAQALMIDQWQQTPGSEGLQFE